MLPSDSEQVTRAEREGKSEEEAGSSEHPEDG